MEGKGSHKIGTTERNIYVPPLCASSWQCRVARTFLDDCKVCLVDYLAGVAKKCALHILGR